MRVQQMTYKSWLYCDNWRAIARAVKEAAEWRCQCCGTRCRRPGEMWIGWQHELTVAHLSQDYTAEVVTVAALCRKCHLAYDAPLAWVARRRANRIRQCMAGQLPLLAAGD